MSENVSELRYPSYSPHGGRAGTDGLSYGVEPVGVLVPAPAPTIAGTAATTGTPGTAGTVGIPATYARSGTIIPGISAAAPHPAPHPAKRALAVSTVSIGGPRSRGGSGAAFDAVLSTVLASIDSVISPAAPPIADRIGRGKPSAPAATGISSGTGIGTIPQNWGIYPDRIRAITAAGAIAIAT